MPYKLKKILPNSTKAKVKICLKNLLLLLIILTKPKKERFKYKFIKKRRVKLWT
jgi:hypothetical protein